MQVPSPISLSNSCTKSEAYFRAARWGGKRRCPECGFQRRIHHLGDGRFRCGRCGYRFREFTGTYLESFRIPFNDVAHLLYLFVLGVPTYRSQRYVNVSLKTAQRAFTIFRQAIYDRCQEALEACVLSGEIDLDETTYGGHRKGKRGWGAAGKCIVFRLFQRNGKVLVFPVPHRRASELIPLITAHTQAGSLYYTDNWQAYTWLSVKGKHVVVQKDDGVPRKKGRDHINGIEGWQVSVNNEVTNVHV